MQEHDSVTVENLRAILGDIFEERTRIDSETHADDHAWIRAKIEEEEGRRQMYIELKKTIMQWSVLGLLGGLAYWFKTGHWPTI